ncbi:unnamed protein product [Prorocentrum cordatum]|nr:unnamed protein product [Polarella glacialis]
MGWQLSRQHGPNGLEEWKPVIIKTIDRLGPVERWNKLNPDKLILEGDEIMQLDNVRFHHNSTQWLKVLQKHYRSASAVESTNRTALLSIRRPRANQEEFDATHPIKEIVTWRRPRHSVQLTFPEKGIGNLMGWQILPSKESDMGSSATVIKKVRDGGLAAQHGEEIAAGDLIVEIDGVSWEMYDKASDFFAVVDETIKAAERKGPEAEPVNLVLERPSKFVRKVRMNMERGVHIDAKILKHIRELRTTTTTELPPMFESMPTDGTNGAQGTDAKEKEEVTGASDDDDDDVIGAGEDDPNESKSGESKGDEAKGEDDP